MNEKRKNWRGMIFDFDGVLVDSVGIKTEAFREIYAPYGPELVQRVVQHHKVNGGLNWCAKFRIYQNEFLQRGIARGISSGWHKYFLREFWQKLWPVLRFRGRRIFKNAFTGIPHALLIQRLRKRAEDDCTTKDVEVIF